MMRNRTKTRLMGIAFAAIAFTGTGAALAQDYGYDDDGLRAYADDSDAAINDRVRFSLDRALGWDDNFTGLWWAVGALVVAAAVSAVTLTAFRSKPAPQPATQ